MKIKIMFIGLFALGLAFILPKPALSQEVGSFVCSSESCELPPNCEPDAPCSPEQGFLAYPISVSIPDGMSEYLQVKLKTIFAAVSVCLPADACASASP
jgi:hypothetical protein